MSSIRRMFGMFSKSAPSKGSDEHEESPARAAAPSNNEHLTATEFHEAYNSGDYEFALRASESLKVKGKITPDFCLFHGSCLMQLGRFQEAEPWLKQVVELETRPHQLAAGYSALGQLLMQSRQYDEAIVCFAKGLKYAPEKSSLHREWAEASLRRGDDPTSALEMAKMAVAAESNPQATALNNGSHVKLGENLATLAWILAAAEGDEVEVDQLVKRAVPLVRHECVQSHAQVQYHSGLAYATLGDRGRGMRHFEEAVLADPKGIWGRGARMMAHGMSKG